MIQRVKGGIQEKMLPPGSRLRCAYETGLKGVGVIANEGWGIFLKKLNLYINRTYMQPDLYALWIRENEVHGEDYLAQVRNACCKFTYRPKFSIIFPVFNTERDFLLKALDSVLKQAYDNWELCAVDGNSVQPGVKEILKQYSKEDERIKTLFLPENEGIAGNSNRSLEMATGDFVAFLDHDDELSPLALYEFSRMLNEDASIDIIYSDEDKIDTSNKRFDPFFKPDWSPDTLRCCNYVSHFLALRRDLAVEVGGFRKEFEGAQDYDFLLRAVENTKKIHHTNKVLYHWRSHSRSIASNAWSKGYAHKNGKKALHQHCQRQGDDATVLDGKDPFRYNVRYNYRPNPLVSIIVVTDGKDNSIHSCLESITFKSTYQNYEIIAVDASGGITDWAFLAKLANSGRPIKRVEYGEVRNDFGINCFGAKFCQGDVLIFLNQYLEVVSPDWIESMAQHALRDEVGAVGGLLMSPDGKVLHAGLVIGLNGGADYVCAGMTPEEVEINPAANLMTNYVRNVSAVSGSCLCVARKKLVEARSYGQYETDAKSDVELCLKLLGQGYQNIYTPFSILSCKDPSYGKASIPISILSSKDGGIFLQKDELYGLKDPYYSLNFDRSSRRPAIRVRKEA